MSEPKPIPLMSDDELRRAVRPLHDNVFVELLPVPQGRIAVGDFTRKKDGLASGRRARVLAVGPGRYHRPFKQTQCLDKFLPVDDIQPGDTLIVGMAAGIEVDPRRPQFVVCVRKDCLGVEE